jgi:hypothetical protein
MAGRRNWYRNPGLGKGGSDDPPFPFIPYPLPGTCQAALVTRSPGVRGP